MADAMPVFSLLPEYRLVSDHRLYRADSPALRARGVPAAQTAQTRGAPGAVRFATGRGCTPLCHPPVAPADRRLHPPAPLARAAEAADPPGLADDPAAPGGAAAGALCHGRPALGRPDDAGVSESPGRSRPDRPCPGAVDLSSGLQPALGQALASHAGDAASLTASAGGGDDRPGGTRQGVA